MCDAVWCPVSMVCAGVRVCVCLGVCLCPSIMQVCAVTIAYVVENVPNADKVFESGTFVVTVTSVLQEKALRSTGVTARDPLS